MSAVDHPVRAKRRDAALNNDRLVQAAREVFAQQGLSATLEDIARHAGVGVGTVYRNFDSKRQIIETLYESVLDAVLADAQAALQIEDPWVALVTFFEATAESQARDRGLCESFLGREGFAPDQAVTANLIATLERLFDRATAAGVLREGVSFTDTWPIFAMLYGIYGLSASNPDLWRRYLAILLDGLRTGALRPLAVPAADAASFQAALAAS